MLSELIVRLILFSWFFPIGIGSISSLHGFSPQKESSPWREDPDPADDFRVGNGNSFDFLGYWNSQMDHPSLDYPGSILTREIKIKQGRLKGVVRELKNKNLKNVEVYLGIPYAAPPVGNLRFMPPGSPPTWRNLRTFDSFGPVCPQTPPDLNHEPHKTMNAGRFNRLKGLLPFLGNQSEDCLFLNIYAPLQEGRVLHRYPVIVYIHGESFEWNSGNPYDGSILASYGKVIVVTINFRLGILGFLKPGISGPTVSNFGLLDQIAALQWVKENIGEFGGDSSSVTLMGHDTGAACINFLMVSPVSMASDGLFHKAILLSGTALSDWALTVNPLQFTIQVAESLNCPLIEENDELSNCLRKKRLSEIMSVKITVPEFQTPFGPVIDGSVIPNTPAHVMGIYQDLFTRLRLTLDNERGLLEKVNEVTDMTEDLITLDVPLKKNPMNGPQFQNMWEWSYVSSGLDGAFTRQFSRQRKFHSCLGKNSTQRYDLLFGMTEWESYHLLNAVSLTFGMLERERDQMLRQYMHSKFEVLPDFALANTLNEYLYWRKPLQGNQPAAMEHLHLVLDLLSDSRAIAPMVQMGLYHAKINPKSYMYVFRHNSKFGEFAGSERSISGEEIPYVFGSPLVNGVGSLSHYRFSLSEQLLSEFVLTYFTNFAKTGNPNAPRRSTYLTQGPREWQQFDVDWPEFDVKNQSFLSLGLPPHIDHQYRSPMTQFWNEELPNLLQNPTSIANKIKYPKPSVKQSYHKPDYNIWENRPEVKSSTDVSVPREKQAGTNPTYYTYGTIRTSPEERHYSSKQLHLANEKEKIVSGQSDHPAETSTETGLVVTASGNSMALTFFLIIGSAFLIINIFIFTILYYKKKRLHLEERRMNSVSGTLDESQAENRGCSVRLYDIVSKRRDEDYESIKLRRKEEERKCSTSTVDPQTRVREWIQQEILHKYTPGFVKSGRYREESSETDEPRVPVKPILKYPEATRKKTPPLKVSVAVDATPSTRGSSVLKQTPIEITKSLDRGLIMANDDDTEEKSLRKSRKSVSLQMLPLESDSENAIIPIEPTIVKIQHFHSKSDPNENCLKTFVKNEDVNVTSRDSIIEQPEIMQEDTLRNILRRNFPKVLPDYPTDLKRLSLPPANHLQSFYTRNKVPPPPPPRVSTLDRKRKDIGDEPRTMTSSATINFKISEDQKGKVDEGKKKSAKSFPKTVIVASNSTPHSVKHPEPKIIIQPVIGPKTGKNRVVPRINLCNEGVSSKPDDDEKNNDSVEESSSSNSTTKTSTIRRTCKKN